MWTNYNSDVNCMSSYWNVELTTYIIITIQDIIQSQSHITTDGQSVIMSRYRAHSGTCDQILFSVRRLFSEICCLVFVGRPLWRDAGSVICLSQSSNLPFRPVSHLKLKSIGLSVHHRKHITSPLRAQQVNVIYRFVTTVFNITITILDIIHRPVFISNTTFRSSGEPNR
jgi:hypothetical protein